MDSFGSDSQISERVLTELDESLAQAQQALDRLTNAIARVRDWRRHLEEEQRPDALPSGEAEEEAALPDEVVEIPPGRPALSVPSASAPVPNWRNSLREYLRELGGQAGTTREELDALWQVVRNEARLSRFPREVQVLILSYACARVRHLGTLKGMHGLQDHQVYPLVSAIGNYARERKPGYVHGPKRDAQPKHGTWQEDARVCLDALTAMASDGQPSGSSRSVLPFPDVKSNPERLLSALAAAVRDAEPYEDIEPLIVAAMDGGVATGDPRLLKLVSEYLEVMGENPSFRTLRSSIREFLQSASASESDSDSSRSAPSALPEDWAWRSLTRGKRAILIGGTPRPKNQDRIQDAFGFSELGWEETEGKPNAVASICERIRSGRFDLVIILRRFVSHTIDAQVLPACRDRGVAWVSVEQGYGIQRIRAEIETKLQPA